MNCWNLSKPKNGRHYHRGEVVDRHEYKTGRATIIEHDLASGIIAVHTTHSTWFDQASGKSGHVPAKYTILKRKEILKTLWECEEIMGWTVRMPKGLKQ